MRVNLKKVLGCGVCFIVLWVIFTFSSTEHVSRMMGRGRQTPEEVMKRLDNRLNRIETDLKSQIKESAILLDIVKKQLSEGLSEVKGESDNDGRPEKREAEEERDSLVMQVLEDESPITVLPILVIACDRVTVKRCLDNLVRYRPNKEKFPIIVSQDCGHNNTYEVIKKFTDADSSITIIKQPDLSDIPLPTNQVTYKGYYKISRHYKFALNYVFVKRKFDAVIIVEDDLDISPDFFEYFSGTYPLLLQDPSLWCVSAWNDNGKSNLIELRNPQRLYRTDFFPGLGWLLRREMWLHVEPRWPKAFFDDWLRDPSNTQGRACIRPEISRTYSFGKVGVSKGLYFDMHLRHMQLNTQFVEFTKHNLTYLLKPIYDATFKKAAYSAPIWRPADVISAAPGDGQSVRVLYSNAKSFRKAAKKLGLMDDLRSGIPRTAYLGIVSCFIRGRRVYLTPDFKWVKYDPAWS